MYLIFIPYGTNNGAAHTNNKAACRRVAEWRVSILDKGLKVNSGRSKVMVGSSGWEDDCKLWKVGNVHGSCCVLPRPMGGKGSHSNFQLFGELPVPHTRLESLKTLIFWFLLISL